MVSTSSHVRKMLKEIEMPDHLSSIDNFSAHWSFNMIELFEIEPIWVAEIARLSSFQEEQTSTKAKYHSRVGVDTVLSPTPLA